MLHTWESLGQVAKRDEYWFGPILRKHQARVADTREDATTEANLWGSVPTCAKQFEDKHKHINQLTWCIRDAQDLRTDGVVENMEEWWMADQRINKTKKMMKAKEEKEVRAARRSLGALRGELRAKVTPRATKVHMKSQNNRK